MQNAKCKMRKGGAPLTTVFAFCHLPFVMSDRLHRFALRLERLIDANVRPRDGGRAVVVPYRGYGNGVRTIIRARVLREKRITRARSAESTWRSVLNAYRRFQSDEVAGATVEITLGSVVAMAVSDDEGYVRVALEGVPLDEALWHEATLRLGDAPPAVAHVLTPTPATQFGIISDIDDTIVQTGATSLRTMVNSVLLQNAATRMPFEGVADLYRALHRDVNPIFYVSSSPWNLYDLLHDYMDLNGIPHGPMFLQDWGLDAQTFIHAEHRTHKLREIQALLDFYPSLRFVLIGDSGQLDPEIYLEVIRANPGRVIACFIRDVSADLRDRAVALLIEQSLASSVPMFYVPDSSAALREATKLGLV